MSKQNSFFFFIILILMIPLPRVEALGIGPPSFELDLQIDGSNTTRVYITSDGLDGELIVGKENLPFNIEPIRINITKDDVNIPVEITFYGNKTLEPGIYEGKITFLAMTGGFVALGIKIRAKINLLDQPDINLFDQPDRVAVSDRDFTIFVIMVTVIGIGIVVLLVFLLKPKKKDKLNDKTNEE